MRLLTRGPRAAITLVKAAAVSLRSRANNGVGGELGWPNPETSALSVGEITGHKHA